MSAPRQSEAARLLTISPSLPDRNVAAMIAAMMLEIDRQPYWFSINHDTRPPACRACRLDYDWNLKGRVGIKTMNRERARRWITHALLLQYQVSREGGKPLTSSLEIARRRAANHQRPPSENTDDDIPF